MAASQSGRGTTRGCRAEATDRRTGTFGGTAADGDPFFGEGLASSRGTTPAEEKRWRSGIFETIKQEMQTQGGGLTIREMCESSRVSRASYYRSWRKQEPKQEEVALRDAIQRWAAQRTS